MANWIAFKTIIVKEVLRFSRIWIQTILPPAVTTALYLIIFGNLIGARVGEMSGVSYLSYIIPGVIMMAVITHSYSNVVSSFYSAKFQRHVEELLISPVPNYVIIAGYICGGVARGFIVGVVVTMVALIFADFTVTSYLLTLLVGILTAVLFALGGFINAIFAKSFDDISIVPTFILTPLTYLGGVFYSISLLPPIWQDVSLFNPILYMVNVFRYGMLGISDVGVVWGLFVIICFIVLLSFVAHYLLDKGIGLKQ